MILFYAANLPLTLAVDLDTRRDSPLRVGVGVFVRPGKLHAPKKSPQNFHMPRTSKRALLRAGISLLRRIQFRGRATLSAGDAALTALASGALMALTLGRVRITPDFSCETLLLSFSGMVTVKPGHIMLAALIWARSELSGRISAWKDMQSKAS